MKKALLLLLILSVLLLGSQAYGFGGCEEDCGKCHFLEKKEAEQILSKMKRTSAKVLDIKMSPVRGLWEVSVDEKGARDVMYVGFSKKQVVRGTVIDIDQYAAKTQEKPVEIQNPKLKYVDTSKVSLDGSLILGNKNAEHKVLVFTDPDCPFCLKLHAELKKVVAESNDTAFYLKLMPLKMHPDAYWKSQSIMCNSSIQMLEDNFEKKPIPRPACDGRVIDENLKLANELGITGTPTLIMPDGFIFVGGLDAKALKDLIISHSRKGL